MSFLDSNYFTFLTFLLINEWMHSSSAVMDVYKCNVGITYDCIINITSLYGFNLQDPSLFELLPRLNKTQFVELCRDYVEMEHCLKTARHCDFKGGIYEEYGLALASALNSACDQRALDRYVKVAKCRKMVEVETAERGCQTMLIKEVKGLLNETEALGKIGRVDIGVTIEKVCKNFINSFDCIRKALQNLCGTYVAEWYYNFLLAASHPTLKGYKCQLKWKTDDIIILCFVSLAAAIMVGIAIYICIQRYRSFMSSQMNFVLSYVPRASQQIRKFAPIILPKTSVALRKLSTAEKAGKGTESVNNPAEPSSETVLTRATAATSAADPSTETTATTSAPQPMPPSETVTEPKPQPANTWWNKLW